jgi:hypothetical protein
MYFPVNIIIIGAAKLRVKNKLGLRPCLPKAFRGQAQFQSAVGFSVSLLTVSFRNIGIVQA